MKEIQYLDLILNGILKNERVLKSFLIRKQKEAENKNFVSETEFVQKCNAVISNLENNIETQYLEKRTELYQIIESLKSKNKPFEKELVLAENLSLDCFNVNLSSITNRKIKGELWYSQIKFVKECMAEFRNQKFKITTEIIDLDIDKYLNFVFSQKSISRESKKNAVLKLMSESKVEKTILNYKIWIDYVFNQQNYWKELTEEDKKLFEELRKKSLLEINASFEVYIKGSPKPKINLEKEFETDVLDRLYEEPFQKTVSDFMEGILPKDLNKLAIVIGKLDFIKTFQTPKAEKILEIEYNTPLTLSEIALKCFYEGTILKRDNAILELENTKHNSGEKLYFHFTRWSTKIERIANPDSKVKLLNKIKLFERVIQSLPEAKRDDAVSDLKVIQGYLSKY
jgi:hypothetical protein